jgi:hypothetical protein
MISLLLISSLDILVADVLPLALSDLVSILLGALDGILRPTYPFVDVVPDLVHGVVIEPILRQHFPTLRIPLTRQTTYISQAKAVVKTVANMA